MEGNARTAAPTWCAGIGDTEDRQQRPRTVRLHLDDSGEGGAMETVTGSVVARWGGVNGQSTRGL